MSHTHHSAQPALGKGKKPLTMDQWEKREKPQRRILRLFRRDSKEAGPAQQAAR